MKYNIHVTQAAERDMANAYDYIDLVLKNPTAADKLLDVADEKIGALAEFPHKFEVVSDKLLSLWGRVGFTPQFITSRQSKKYFISLVLYAIICAWYMMTKEMYLYKIR